MHFLSAFSQATFSGGMTITLRISYLIKFKEIIMSEIALCPRYKLTTVALPPNPNGFLSDPKTTRVAADLKEGDSVTDTDSDCPIRAVCDATSNPNNSPNILVQSCNDKDPDDNQKRALSFANFVRSSRDLGEYKDLIQKGFVVALDKKIPIRLMGTQSLPQNKVPKKSVTRVFGRIQDLPRKRHMPNIAICSAKTTEREFARENNCKIKLECRSSQNKEEESKLNSSGTFLESCPSGFTQKQRGQLLVLSAKELLKQTSADPNSKVVELKEDDSRPWIQTVETILGTVSSLSQPPQVKGRWDRGQYQAIQWYNGLFNN